MSMPHTPPQTEQRPVTTTTHGDTRVDEYAWLRDQEDETVLDHLRAENAWTEATLAHLEPVRERLFEEIRSRIVETDLSVPVRRGPWWYYSRTVEGLSYPIHCRRPAGAEDEPTPIDPAADEDEVVLYDENVEAGEREFFSVGTLAVSPDHQLLAEATDVVGNERYVLRFRRLDGGDAPTEAIEDVSYGFAWARDSATCFYTRVDDAWRPHQLWRHVVGTAPTDDVLVLEEPDARFNIGVGKTRDGEVIVISVSSSATSETRVLSADEPFAEPLVLLPRVEGVEHGVEHLVTRDGERAARRSDSRRSPRSDFSESSARNGYMRSGPSEQLRPIESGLTCFTAFQNASTVCAEIIVSPPRPTAAEIITGSSCRPRRRPLGWRPARPWR